MRHYDMRIDWVPIEELTPRDEDYYWVTFWDYEGAKPRKDTDRAYFLAGDFFVEGERLNVIAWAYYSNPAPYTR